MNKHSEVPDHLTIQVVRRDDPVSLVTEADAAEAIRRYPHIALRGPVFGYAEQRPEDGHRWRLLCEMNSGYPQEARDGLNSHLWFRAKDGPDDRALRRDLLSAVALLDTEPVDEVCAGGVRYRIVRGDEFSRIGVDGLEPPRPTDPEPAEPVWDADRSSPSRIEGFVIDHSAATGVMEGLERMALLSLRYTSDRFPTAVLADSRLALETHPGVVLLPAAFTYVERRYDTWEPLCAPQPTPHDARRVLVNALSEVWPRMYRLSGDDIADYARAAEVFRALGRANDLTVCGRRFEIVRSERMIRVGADGPEGPRPSDPDDIEPMKIHPTMDELGRISYES